MFRPISPNRVSYVVDRNGESDPGNLLPVRAKEPCSSMGPRWLATGERLGDEAQATGTGRM